MDEKQVIDAWSSICNDTIYFEKFFHARLIADNHFNGEINMVHPAQRFKRSDNGVKSSGKHSQTALQFGVDLSGQSATSQNDGVSVTISEKAEALSALHKELKNLEETQLEVGQKMALLIHEQVRLSEKTRAIMLAMEKLINNA